jgi:hypothetical protein
MKEKIVLTPEEQIQKVIEKGKKQFKKVYRTYIADETIIWRKLKRSEYKDIMDVIVVKDVPKLDENGNPLLDEEGNNIMESVDDMDATYDLRQELIAKTVILYPGAEIVDDLAACADIISTECMIKSGFGEAPMTEEC